MKDILVFGIGGFFGAGGEFFFNFAGTFTDAVAHVVHASAHGDADFIDFDFDDVWGVKRVDTFYALAGGDFADGESFLDAGAFAANDDACEDLDAFFVAFANFAMDLDAVANFEGREIGSFL